jgi:hypothetical protein
MSKNVNARAIDSQKLGSHFCPYLSGSNASIFDLVQLLDFGTWFHPLPSLSVLLGSWTRSQRVASTKFTIEKFKFITEWFLVSLIKLNWRLSFSVLLLGGAGCNGSLEIQAKVRMRARWNGLSWKFKHRYLLFLKLISEFVCSLV